MELLFKNKTLYTTENYQKFLNFHTKIYGIKEDMTTFFIFLMLLILTISLFYSHYPMQGFLFVCITIGFLIWRIYRPYIVIKKQTEKIKSNHTTTSQIATYYFYDDYFVIHYQKQYSKVKYHKLYKIYETSDFFYLYYDKEHTFLLSKSGFSLGDSNSFSHFIKEKFKNHFIVES